MLVGGRFDEYTNYGTFAVDPLSGDIFFGGATGDGFTTEGYAGINRMGGFLVRAHPSGKAVWTKSIRWTSTTVGVMAIALHAPSSLPRNKHFVAACGYTRDKLPARYTTTTGTSTATVTTFLQRYSLNGTLEWETGFPTTAGKGSCLSVQTLSGGHTVVLLQLSDTGSTYQGVTPVSGAGQSIAMMMLDSAGGLVWFNSYGDGADPNAEYGGLAIHDTGDLATSSIYATGTMIAAFGDNTAYGG
jgi:hypothetical protein